MKMAASSTRVRSLGGALTRGGGPSPAETALARLAPTDAGGRVAAEVAALVSRLESLGSRRVYAGAWSRWCRWLGPTPPGAATAGDVARYMDSMRAAGGAASYRSVNLAVLRSVYAALVRAGGRVDNPAREVRAGRVGTPPRRDVLDTAAARTLLASCTVPGGDGVAAWRARRDRALVAVLLGVGIRRGSVSALRVGDWTPGAVGRVGLLTLRVAKGGAAKTVPVPKWVETVLRSWVAELGVEAPMFPAMAGGEDGLTGSAVWTAVRRAASRAGLAPIGPHALRRTLATLAHEAGAPTREIQAGLGHAEERTTEIYIRTLAKPTAAPGDRFGQALDVALRAGAERVEVRPSEDEAP